MFSSIAVTPAWEVTVEGKELLRCYCRPRCCCFFFFPWIEDWEATHPKHSQAPSDIGNCPRLHLGSCLVWVAAVEHDWRRGDPWFKILCASSNGEEITGWVWCQTGNLCYTPANKNLNNILKSVGLWSASRLVWRCLDIISGVYWNLIHWIQ